MKLVGLKTVEMASEGRFTTIVIDDSDLNQVITSWIHASSSFFKIIFRLLHFDLIDILDLFGRGMEELLETEIIRLVHLKYFFPLNVKILLLIRIRKLILREIFRLINYLTTCWPCEFVDEIS
jgi:hypothetical protein